MIVKKVNFSGAEIIKNAQNWLGLGCWFLQLKFTYSILIYRAHITGMMKEAQGVIR